MRCRTDSVALLGYQDLSEALGTISQPIIEIYGPQSVQLRGKDLGIEISKAYTLLQQTILVAQNGQCWLGGKMLVFGRDLLLPKD